MIDKDGKLVCDKCGGTEFEHYNSEPEHDYCIKCLASYDENGQLLPEGFDLEEDQDKERDISEDAGEDR